MIRCYYDLYFKIANGLNCKLVTAVILVEQRSIRCLRAITITTNKRVLNYRLDFYFLVGVCLDEIETDVGESIIKTLKLTTRVSILLKHKIKCQVILTRGIIKSLASYRWIESLDLEPLAFVWNKLNLLLLINSFQSILKIGTQPIFVFVSQILLVYCEGQSIPTFQLLLK